MLGAAGRVLPATEGPVVLKAQTASGELIGQVRVSKGVEIAAVSLVPPDAIPPPAVLRAIAEADQVVLGPGSLFTSVLAACVVPGIREALSATRAQRVYVANLREQLPETAGFDIARLLASFARPRCRPRRHAGGQGSAPARRVPRRRLPSPRGCRWGGIAGTRPGQARGGTRFAGERRRFAVRSIGEREWPCSPRP